MALQEVLDKIKAVVGPSGWMSHEDPAVAPWLIDSHGVFTGACALFVRPATTREVSRILAICHQADVAVVPQGGNTSRCGAATPDKSGRAILLNLGRMNAIRAIDADNYSITVEAGCILQTVQQTAENAGRYFPLSLGAQGSCQIGGNLATNAGGINVLRYGNTRDLVLGLELVLPDGQVLDQLLGLRKDNTGYDLKQLFIGSEGTLGVITAAVLKLFPLPVDSATAFCAMRDIDACITLLARARVASGDGLNSFELIPGIAVELATRHIEGISSPLSDIVQWHVLVEFSATQTDAGIGEKLEGMLEQAFEDQIITDATIAQSGQQRAELWRLREAVVEAQVAEGASIKHDVSVPISRIPEFLCRSEKVTSEICPGVRPYPFGHVGDGNIHYNLMQPEGASRADFLALKAKLHRAVYDITDQLGGSISAEHGVGQVKRSEIGHYKSALELELMKRLKQLFDPKGIMNPGKVLPDSGSD